MSHGAAAAGADHPHVHATGADDEHSKPSAQFLIMEKKDTPFTQHVYRSTSAAVESDDEDEIFPLPSVLTRQAKRRVEFDGKRGYYGINDNDGKDHRCNRKRYICCIVLLVLASGSFAAAMGAYLVRNRVGNSLAAAASISITVMDDDYYNGRLNMDDAIETAHYTTNMRTYMKYVDVYAYCDTEERMYGILCKDVYRILGLSIVYFNIRYSCIFDVRFGLLKRLDNATSPSDPANFSSFYANGRLEILRAHVQQVRIVPLLGRQMLTDDGHSMLNGLQIVKASPKFQAYRYGYAYQGVLKLMRGNPMYTLPYIEDTEVLDRDNETEITRNVTKYVVPTAIRVTEKLVSKLFIFFLNGVLVQFASRYSNAPPTNDTETCLLKSSMKVVSYANKAAPSFTRSFRLPESSGVENGAWIRRLFDAATHMAVREVEAQYEGSGWDDEFFENYVRLNAYYSKFMKPNDENNLGEMEHTLRTVQEFRSWLPHGTMDPDQMWQYMFGAPRIRQVTTESNESNDTSSSPEILIAVYGSSIKHSLRIRDHDNCTFIEESNSFADVRSWAYSRFVSIVTKTQNSSEYHHSTYSTLVKTSRNVTIRFVSFLNEHTMTVNTIIDLFEGNSLAEPVINFTSFDMFAIYYCHLMANEDLQLQPIEDALY